MIKSGSQTKKVGTREVTVSERQQAPPKLEEEGSIGLRSLRGKMCPTKSTSLEINKFFV